MYMITSTGDGSRLLRYRSEEYQGSVMQLPASHAQEPLNAAEAAAAAQALLNRVQCLQELLGAQVANCLIGDAGWARTWDELHAAHGAYIKLKNIAEGAA